MDTGYAHMAVSALRGSELYSSQTELRTDIPKQITGVCIVATEGVEDRYRNRGLITEK